MTSISTEMLGLQRFSHFSSRNRLVHCRQGLTEPSRAGQGQGGTEHMLGPEERAAQTGREPHVLEPPWETPTLLTLSTCWHIHTQTFVLRHWHTHVHVHTAGPSQLTPCNCTDHIRGSGEKGGHMWMMVHANEMNKARSKVWKSHFWHHSSEWICQSKSFNILY